MMTLGEIPTIGLVNKGALESVKNRMFYLYYADGFAYLHRNETNSNKPYDLKLKLALSDVLADPLYVLQFATGFTDDIMGAIYDSIEKSKGHVPNLGNVINYFTVKDKTNFEIQLNMHEITNDNMLGDMTIGLGVINNEQTNNKNYLGKASFKMEMPIAKGVFDIKLESNDLTLINIGKTLDFTALNNYINSYPYKEGEEYEIVNGKATLASQKQYTITFEENGGNNVSDITAVKDSPITLPTFENRSVVDTANGTRTIYRFAGWYQSSEFEEHNKFTETHMSRGNKVLYAKWEVVAVDYVRTISFNSNGGSSIDSISEVAGVWIDVSNKVPTKANTYVDKGYNWFNQHAGKWTYEVTRYTFAGWYTDSSLTTKFNGYVPNYNTTLYAKWNASTTTEYYYNWERP